MWQNRPIKPKTGSPDTDELLFNEWYHQHWELLFKLACKKTGSADDAYDLVHDLFADIWRSMPALSDDPTAVRSYLVACLYHKVFNYFRSKGLREKHYKNLETFLTHQLIADPAHALQQQEQEQENIQLAIDKEITGMPDKMKKIFIRNYYEDQSISQIAGDLSLSKQTVKNQLHIASKRLRRAVKQLAMQVFFFL
ncbi:RNA polymerase sigma factor [Longitalea arenae]|uniref:RNA polymerase sigma factor n=1 Tax=Longitalea arenae TaxID=2812558 RepID=UPI00196713DB|nr:sigma-70 family RNA polymerase sigma factor [Longitalea arenae]